ncbi:nicotinate-nucleotide--dimethylbenzimidazole phosphoribosyltransferase [Streptomyces broussonetiae]|uniref:Nicotinate-nucleotide--dimethylbenzimidazole phosphoribosyltransferase n=2 Tax=Streptomyces broussonetiae TaxID=2686304 RepID=A0A6I6MZ74_9ACTN|nr:nicotinate-nucleotide--dimethylbenzimidazole phosphoribosyltransferase [Streptomyces broussonetiae]QHA03619.1 nicotinate-nucleotide--dimethylbenzimidazole phosphoribosyltransferase [Streptomyces broussonetiae]
MTDTGQVPGEGQPESAGMVEQPGVAAHGAYTYLSEAPAEDEELLLPGAQGAWGNEVPPPAPEPVLEAFHEPGPHETAGRDSGSVDLNGVRLPNPAPASAPPSPVIAAPQEQPAAAQPPRRPLHLGPPIPDASASPVRSLADRGPAGAPVRQPGPPATGPEYLDAQPLRDMAVPQSAAPWGTAPVPAPAAVAQAGVQAPAAETVDPAVVPADAVAPVHAAVPVEAVASADAALPAEAALPAQGPIPAEAADQAEPSAAEAAVARIAHQAAVPVVHGHDGVQSAHGHDGVYPTAPAVAAESVAPFAVEGAPQPDAEAAQGAAVAVVEAGTEAVTAVSESAPNTPVVTEVTEVTEAAGTVAPAQVAPTAPADQAAAVVAAAVAVEETHAFATPGEAVPAQAAEDVPVATATATAAGVTETPEPAQPTVVARPGEVANAPQAALAAEGAVVAEGAAESVTAVPVAAVPAPDAPEPSEPAQMVQETVEAEDAAPAPAHQPAPAPGVAAEPQPATAEPQPLAAQAQPVAVQPVPAVEEAEAPERGAIETGAPEPEAIETGAHAAPAQAAVPAPAAAVVEVAAAPEAHAPQPAQGPQLAEPAGPGEAEPAAEALPVIPEVQVAAVPEAAPVTDLVAPAGPQTLPGAESAPTPAGPAGDAAAEQEAAEPLPSGVPLEPQPEQPLGQFVPVEGQVPTTPHLAPTPPQPIVLPAQETQQPVATVPAPREGDQVPAPAAQDAAHTPEVVQHAEDLETRPAEQQEESVAQVAEAQQSAGPAAPGYADAEREAVLKVMRERRDIRNGFRNDPIPHEVLLRVLEAAHTAPSVGHSQPWDFVVIRSADTRRTMHELAMRQRDAYAKSLPKGRAKQFKELKIEAILDTPVNIVVTADPTRGGRHTLGRYTQPQMAPYSSALAVENLWLAARAEGLGVGWVSFFDEREMVRTLGLPEHLEVVAYLCVGYVDEFPDEPELMQAGWSKRRPLSWVVHEETYGRRALPGEEPHDLLAETVAQIRPLDAKALGEAWERQKRMTKPAGALGMLEIISAQLAGLSRQCPPPIPEPAAVAIFAGDHGVHAQGVTPWPQEVTAQMVANFLGGGAVCNAFAAQVGAEVCVVDVGVAADLPATPGLLPRKIRGGTSDMTTGPAMTREEAKAAIEVGIETARDLVAAGNKALLTGEMGIANTTASAALISVFTGADPAEVTGRGTGINDETLARKTEVVRRALDFHQPDPADPLGVLAAIGGFEHAAMVGLLLGGASLRTPVILDGVSAGAAALVARAIAPEVLAACIAGHRSAEPGHVAALNKLGLRPLVDLDLRLGEGTGALLALPLVQSTARAMHEVATFDSAGVTEK